MKICIKKVTIVLFFLFFSNKIPMAEDIYLDVSKSHISKIPIAIAPFTFSTSANKNLPELLNVLKNDLKISGLFTVISNEELIEKTDLDVTKPTIDDLQEWILKGAQILIKGGCRLEDNKLKLTCYVYNLSTNRQLLGKVYRASKKTVRNVVHKFVDDLILHLTGQRGVMQTKIVFVSNSGGNRELFVIDFDGYRLHQLTHDHSVVATPAWSPDGRRISYTTYFEDNPDLHTIDIFQGKREKISVFPGLNTTPSWSPDGKWIAIVLTRDGNAEIYKLRCSDKKLWRLTQNSKIDCSPAWSPDGKKIAYTSSRGGIPKIYLMDIKGRFLKLLSDGLGYCDGAAWSPKGDRIAFASNATGNFDIYITDIAKDNTVRLTSDKGNDESPVWSPDGRYISFSSNRDGNTNIYVVNTNGTNIRRITYQGGDSVTPDWSPFLD